MHYYQHHIGDFIKDTNFLTNEEIGIYMKLIWLYYDTEKPLLNNLLTLSIKVASRGNEEVLSNILGMFFTLENDEWHHSRCDKEIAEYHGFIESKSKAGKASAERRLNMKSTGVEQVLNTKAMDVQLTTNHKPLTTNQDIKASSAESKIPPCPHQAIIDIYHQTLPELPKVISWNKTREAHLKQRWRELFIEFECKSTEEALDWFRNDFFQFIKNSKFLTGRTQSKDRRPFLADLEWVIKPTNFTKIIERKYL